MDLTNYEKCCGIQILYNFGYTTTGFWHPDNGTPDNTSLEKWYKEPDKEAVMAFLKYNLNIFHKSGMFTIALDGIQHDIVGPWLEEFGFECVKSSGHPHMRGTTIHLYVYVINPVPEAA